MKDRKPDRDINVRWKTNFAALTALVFAFASVASAQAQSRSTDNGWQFTAAPYLLLPWMNGKTALKGHEVGVDVSPGDIFSHLQIGGMGTFEGRKAGWGFGADAMYMALGTTVDLPPTNVDVNQGSYTFTGFRQLKPNVDLLFGARWIVIQGKLGFKGPLQATLEETKQWVEPIVGLKLRQPLGHKLHLMLEGDIGGFGAGSDFAWQLFPALGIDVSKRARLGFGYRVISEDYQTGEGTQLFRYDVVTQGIVLGMSFHF